MLNTADQKPASSDSSVTETVEKYECRTCSTVVTTKNPVCRHYKSFPEHKPEKQRNNSARTLLHGLSDYHRKNQIRQFLSELKEEEMTRIVLPALSKLVTTFDYLLLRCTNRWNANKAESLERAVHQELVLLLS